MRLRNVPKAAEGIANSDYVIPDPAEKKGKWHTVFANAAPIHIEVGMGKGQFLATLSAMHPEIDYIGIERYSSVLYRAVQRLEKDRQEGRPLPQNLRFLCMDAKELEDVFAPGEVDRIYLNFSDPWPKARHAKRRLPSREFLRRFDRILSKNGRIEFKTDNQALFAFALEELEPAGWKLEQMTRDLHRDAEMGKDNVMTEYEQRFSAAGNPICKYIIYR